MELPESSPTTTPPRRSIATSCAPSATTWPRAGPDGKGEWYSQDNRVGFGHRRLSIIDLSDRAAQPMASADGRLVVSFNGEIYNYRELKKDLEARGRVFRTESDTEVLLQLYAEKAEAMVHDLRGMFAFALWDARKQALLLARDPYGIKPLYYADDGWTCRFASQVKALLTSAKVSRLPEPAGLAGFYLFGSVPEPYTLYQEIRSVPAGSYQWVDATGPQVPVQYFSIAQIWAEAEQRRPWPNQQLQEVVRQAVLDSVRAPHGRRRPGRRLPIRRHRLRRVGRPDGEIAGCHCARAALPHASRLPAVRLRPSPSPSTNFATPTPTNPPSQKRSPTTTASATPHASSDEQEFRDDLPKILAAMDQPSIDGINTWFVSKAASEAGLKVAVSGLGGDELFGGYPSFRDIPKWVRLLWLPSPHPRPGRLMEQVQAAFAPLFPRINPKAAGMLRYGGTYPGAYLLRRGLFLPRELPALIGKEQAEEGLRRLRPLEHIRSQLTANRSQPPVHSSRFTVHSKVATLESTLYMRNQLLRDTDWASMAHSLEVRTPLVDATLLRQLAGPLATAKAGNHKQLLASSPAKPLPDEIASRAKSGFTTPIADWQQRGDNTQTWRKVPNTGPRNCPWAQALELCRGKAGADLSMALRILALVTDAYGAGGGIAQYNRDLFQGLAHCGNVAKVVVLTRNGKAATDDVPEKVLQQPAQPGRLAFTYQAIRTIRQHGPFDVIFCGHLYMAPLAALLSKLAGAPVWLQLHGIEAWHRPSFLQRWAAERAQLVTAVSRHTRRLFLNWANCAPETIKVLPNTVDERFSPGPKPDALLDRYQLRGKKVLLTVSRLAASERYKGHDRVIQAVAELRSSLPDIVYVVAGDGDDRPRLEQLASELGVIELVRFIGHVPDSELPDLYRSADVFIMPSTGEGFGIVFLQALASGIPVIGGDNDGSRDPLRDGLDGYLVSADNPKVLPEAIGKILLGSDPLNPGAKVFSRQQFESMVCMLSVHLAV